MTNDEHRERHKLLHGHFDELLADFIAQTRTRPSEATVLEMLKWSYAQTIAPTSNPQSETSPEPQYGWSRSGDTVLVTMSDKDSRQFVLLLGMMAGIQKERPDLFRTVALANRLMNGCPNWTPYEIPPDVNVGEAVADPA